MRRCPAPWPFCSGGVPERELAAIGAFAAGWGVTGPRRFAVRATSGLFTLREAPPAAPAGSGAIGGTEPSGRSSSDAGASGMRRRGSFGPAVGSTVWGIPSSGDQMWGVNSTTNSRRASVF